MRRNALRLLTPYKASVFASGIATSLCTVNALTPHPAIIVASGRTRRAEPRRVSAACWW